MNWFDIENHVARRRSETERMAAEVPWIGDHLSTARRTRARRAAVALGAVLVRWGYRLQGDQGVLVEMQIYSNGTVHHTPC